LVDEINRHLRCLTALGKNPSTGEMTANEAFLPLLVEKFPEEIHLAWDVHVQSVTGTKRDLPEFLNFAQVRAAAKRAAAASSGGGGFVKQDDPKQQEPGPSCRERQRTRQTEKRAARGATTVLHAAVNSSCPICKGDHDVTSCEEFLQADAHTRSRMAARNKLCFRCLQSGHRAKACKVRWKCTMSGCGGSHHGLLHRSQSPPRDQTPEPPRSRSCMLTANGGAQQDGQCMLVQCLLDPGSKSSFIRKDVADALGLSGPQEVIRLERSSQPRIRYPIHALVLPKICGKIRQAPVKLSEWPHLSNLPVADQCEERTFTIDVLIGLDYYFNLVGGDVRRDPAGGPVAIHSQLGWILCGQTTSRPTTAVTTLLTHVEESADQILRRFWDLEAIGIATDNQTAPQNEEALKDSRRGFRLTANDTRSIFHDSQVGPRCQIIFHKQGVACLPSSADWRAAKKKNGRMQRRCVNTWRTAGQKGLQRSFRKVELGTCLTTLYTKVRARRRSPELFLMVQRDTDRHP
ncbi:hypothetical protein T08_4516, partial [Trichinella sp. T8]